MTWTLYPIDQYKFHAVQWDSLAQSIPGTPFLESSFLQPLIDTFGTGYERLCLHHTDGELDAAAIVQSGSKGMWQTFQPSQLPLGAWISANSIDLAAAGAALVSDLPGLTLGLGITQIDSRFHARPADTSTLRAQDYIQTAWVDIDGSFDAYWEARGKNLRQNARKQRNKLQAEGSSTRLECITTAADVAKAMVDYGALESAGWKTAEGTAIHPDNPQGKFYQKMLENFCTQGRGRIYRYRFGDKVVAMDLCIQDGTAIVILKTTYDETYRTVSPSTLMRQDEFQQLFEEANFKRIEFYGKVMEWHTRWTTNSRDIYHATLYRWGLLKKLQSTVTPTQE
jgi:CelD/BcsL family acetyltransferase involved in cellulose biosynthesis